MFYPEIPKRLPAMLRRPLLNGMVTGAQVDAVRLLTDPETFGGRAPTYFDTVVSDLVVEGRDLFILRKPLDRDGFKCTTAEDRWNWCEAQCMHGLSRSGAVSVRPVPLVRREGRLCLGGPGSIQDWVLKITCDSVIVEPGFITLRRAA